MPDVKTFIEAGNEYAKQAAAVNPVISRKPIKPWLDEVADTVEREEFIQEATLDYNLSLLDVEQAMSEQEMAEILEEKMGRREGEKAGKWEGVNWKEMPAKNLRDVSRKQAVLKALADQNLIVFADDEEDEVTELKREIELLKDALREATAQNAQLKAQIARYVNDTMGEYWQARRGEL